MKTSDVSFDGIGQDVAIGHVYNSGVDGGLTNADAVLGAGEASRAGWKLSTGVHLYVYGSLAQTVTYVDGTGGRTPFVRDPQDASKYRMPHGLNATMTRITGTEYDVKFNQDKLTYRFRQVDPGNTSTLQLTEVEDRNGHKVKYNYTRVASAEGSLLSSVVDDRGENVNVAYTTVAGRQVPAELRWSDGATTWRTTFTYASDIGLLASSTDAAGQRTEYGYASYGSGSRFLLDTVKQVLNNGLDSITTKITYEGASGRVASVIRNYDGSALTSLLTAPDKNVRTSYTTQLPDQQSRAGQQRQEAEPAPHQQRR